MRSIILRTTTRILSPVIVAASVYLLLRGHDAPGGGFIGGLVAGSVVVLRYLSHAAHAGPSSPPAAGSMLGAGISLATLVGLAAVLAGGAFLQSAVWKPEVPLLGEVKITASLFFDLGVFLVVVGTVVGLVSYLGEEPERAEEAQ